MATPSPRRRWLVLLLLVAALLFAAFLWQRPLLHIGAGYAAKHACSCHFLQGRELEEIRENDLNFSVLGQVSLSADAGSVTASFFGLTSRTAVFSPGAGCTLRNGGTPLRTDNSGAAAGAKNYELSSEPAALTPALDFGMQAVPGGGARGLVVLQDGRVVAERYAPGYSATTPLLGWSMTKTLTALAVGAHLRQTSERPATTHLGATDLLPAWTDDRRQITLANLLRMNSGLGWNESYGAISDATIMLHEQPDFAAYAGGMPLQHPPGTVWNYSSGTTNIIMDWLRQERGGPDDLYALLYDSLFHRIAPSLLIEPDQSGLPVGSSYGWATARDWANLGQFLLQEGRWKDDTLVDAAWIEWMTRPAPGSEGVYGGHLWLPGPETPDLPTDAYMMRGFQDQRVFVIPSRRVVVARLGHGVDKSTDFNTLVRMILDALPD